MSDQQRAFFIRGFRSFVSENRLLPARRSKTLRTSQLKIESLEERSMLAPIAFGQTIYETIGTAGDRDLFEFSVASPTKIYVDSLSTYNSNTAWTLRDANGILVNRFSMQLASPVTDVAIGNYSLEFAAGNDSIGAYSFRLLNLGAASAITPGVVVNNALNPSSETDLYYMTVNAGDSFTFDTSTATPLNANWRLIDPLNREVFHTSLSYDVSNVSFALPGTYRLLVEGYFSDPGTVDYGFNVIFLGNTPIPPFTGTALTLGSTVSSDISLAGEVDKYTFTLGTNKMLSFDTLTTAGSLNWTLEGPSGIEVNTRPLEYDWANIANSTLSLLPGNYQLRINGGSGATGAYSFRMLDLAAATVLTPGSLVTGTLNPASEVDAYRFTASVGQRFYLDSQTTAPQNAYWRLLNPLGQVISSTYLGSDMEPAAFTLAGQYTLLIEGPSFDTGSTNYSFRVQEVVDAAPLAITLGTTIAGNIAVTGEQDRYTFTLGSDSKLTLDTLTTPGNVNWTLTGPTGVVVNSRDLQYDWVYEPNPTLNLLAGNYQVTIDGSGDATGAYSFRMLDLAAATVLTPGSLVTGTLNPASEVDAYRFTASVGQRFYLDSQTTAPQSAYWRLLNPLEQVVSTTHLGSDMEPAAFTLAGQYTLLIEGPSFDTGSTNYSFRVQEVVDAAPLAITLGTTIAGNIAVTGEQDRYTFTLGSDSKLTLDTLTTPGNVNWTLTGPTGVVVNNRDLQYDWVYEPNPTLNLLAGNYQVTIDGSGDATGAYSFRMLDLAAATVLTPGSLVTGTLNPASEVDAYRFTASVGQRFYLDSQTTAPQSAYWRLLNPLGQVVSTTHLGSDMEPTAFTLAGQYTLLIEGPSFDTGSTNYSFRVQEVVDAAPLAITLGTTIAGNIAVTGEQDRYTLTLASLSRLYVDVLSTNVSANIKWKGPGIDTSMNFVDSERWDVPAGSYEITVDGLTDSVGAYSFRVLDLDTATVVTPGSPVTGSLSPATETDMVRFTANAGDRFDFTNATTNPQNAYWRLLDPIGRTVFYAYLGSSQTNVNLIMGGTYTLLIEGYIGDTGVVNYGFTVSFLGNTPPVPFTGTALTLGTTVSSDISVSGEEDSYIFTLASSKRLYFDSISSPSFGMSWTLDGPTGSIVANRYFEYDWNYAGLDPSMDLIAGNYRLTIKGVSNATGAYSFRMLDMASATAITPGTPVSGTLIPATTTNMHRFTAAAGDLFYFDSQTATPQNASWRLINPLGQTIFSTPLYSDGEPAALSVAGTYTVLVEGYIVDTGTTAYSFNVQPLVATAPAALTIGSTVSSTIAVTGERDRYTFTLAGDERLYFDALLAPSNLNWSLEGTTGVVVTNRPLIYDMGYVGVDPTLNLLAGNYTLTIDGTGDGTGAYSFRLLDYAGAIPLTPGTVVNGTLDPATATNMHRFTAAAGDLFYFDSQTATPQNSSWRLINPLGQTIFSTSLYSDGEPAALPVAGTYTVLVEGYIVDTGTTAYSFNVQPLVATAPAALTIGSTVSSTISVTGERDRYTFTLAGDKRLYFDALLAPSNLNWSLEGTTGVVVTNRPLIYDMGYAGIDPTLNLLAGNYTLTIDGNGDSTGAYSFRLFDLNVAASLINGTVVTGTLNPATSSVPYHFTVAAGEQYYFDTQTGAPQNAQWRLVDPYGRSIFQVWLGSDVAQEPFVFAGQYTLLVEGYIVDAGATNYSFRIQKVDPNPADSQLSPSSIPENQPSVSVVGLFSTSDVDSTSTQSYALVSGAGSTNNSDFTITSNQLKTVNSFNFEAKSSYSIRVRTTDNIGLSFEKQYTINVIDVNENPTNISLTNSSLAENAGANAFIGTLSGTDPDAGDSLTFSLPAGVGSNGLFNISGTSLRANNSFDFEALSSYSITVRATDSGGLTFDKLFTITVLDVNENPTNISLTNASLAENAGANALIGTLSGTDPDAGDSLTFSLPAGVGSNGLFNISGTSLRANNSFDFEALSSYSITVRATDSGGLTFDKLFTITVLDVNENPTNISLTNASLAENAGANALIGTLSGTDPDAGDSLTFSLPAGVGSNGLFNISGTSLRANNSFDFEALSSYSITVRATDSGGLSFERQFTISIQDLKFRVTTFVQNASSVAISFTEPINPTLLNLYDGIDSAVKAADVTLVGATTGVARVSMVWDATTNTATLIKTGSPLLADNYTLTLFSRLDGWKDVNGDLLDGDGDGNAGGDLVRTFVVAPTTARIVSIPDFSRGATATAGQNVNLLSDSGSPGVPITISDGTGVLSVVFDVAYDDTMINFSSAFFSVLPVGWTTGVNLVSVGRMRITLSGSTQLPSGPQTITRLLASIPANVPYGASEIIKIENLSVFTADGGATPVPSIADAGLHKAIFVGDNNGDGQYTAQDAGWTAGVQAGAYSGFDAYSWTDPSIVADVNQNGSLDGLDSSWIARKGLSNALQPEIPNLPAGSIAIQAGVDPTIAADALVATRRGAIVNVPIRITDSASGLWGVDVFLDYNTALLDLPSGLNVGGVTVAGMFNTESGWSIESFTDDVTGKTRIAMYRGTPSAATVGIIANVAFQVKPDAAFGVTPILVNGNANVPPFSFSFVSGSVNVINSPPTDIALNQNTVLENTSTAADLLFGQLSTVDLDPIDSYVYDLVTGAGDADNVKFSIVTDKIYIKQGEVLDFEAKPSYSVRVRSTDSGGLSTIKTLTLNVTDVNEPVVLTRSLANVTGNVLSTLSNAGTWSDPESQNSSVLLTASLGDVVKNANGTWSWSFVPSTKLVGQQVTITANDGTNNSSVTFTVDALVAVTNRQVYYKGSGYDLGAGGVPAALDSVKVLLRAGTAPQLTTFANVIGYSRGINGVVLDVAGLVSTSLTASDFTFRVAPANATGVVTPSTWGSAPAPTLIDVTPGTATTPARIRLVWADNAIQNTWLQIIVKANANTGLVNREVYYLGHALGEVNGATPYRVTSADQSAVQTAVSSSLVSVNEVRDVNKNGRITSADLSFVQVRVISTILLRDITIPASGSAEEGEMSKEFVYGPMEREDLKETPETEPDVGVIDAFFSGFGA